MCMNNKWIFIIYQQIKMKKYVWELKNLDVGIVYGLLIQKLDFPGEFNMKYTKKLTCNKCKGYKKLKRCQYCVFGFKIKIKEKKLNGIDIKYPFPLQRCPKPLTWNDYVFLIEKMKNLNKFDNVQKVLNLIFRYGGIDGGHHLRWVIDQTVRILLNNENEYDEWVKKYNYDVYGENTYNWDVGIAP